MKDDKRRMLMEHALSLKNEHTFSTALVHGDFAPWNIKMIASGRSILVDWEDAETEGAPLYDICHFFLIQSFLFKTRWSLQGMLENRHVKKYIKLLGIDLETAGQLATYYHIHRILSLMGKNEMEGYGEYLFDNLISRRVP
jgi:aminoglycoside phosphotransferase (APT) family kinase protein